MHVLICNPGLSFQADAAIATQSRARAIQKAGITVTVMGYPASLVNEYCQLGLSYIGVETMHNPSPQAEASPETTQASPEATPRRAPRRGGYRDAAAASVARLSREQNRKLIMTIKHLPLTISGTEGFSKAMVTRGGINLDEVWPKTLASKRVRGLFFAGEILDVDAPCGGFNLQWAFSSGFLAAQNLSRV